MITQRPKLTDSNEYRIIKEVYFKGTRPFEDKLDPVERLERMESRYRNNQKSPR